MQSYNNQVMEEKVLISPDLPINSVQNKTTKAKPSITIKAFSIVKYLVITAIILVVLNMLVIVSFQLGMDFPGTHRFYFDREMNLPSYFSSIIILIASFLLSIIAVIKRKEKDNFAKSWVILAIIFLFMSIDESVVFHELLIEPINNKFHLPTFLRFSWVIIGGIFVLVFTVSYLRFFFSLPKTTKILFFISGATFILGAVGLEMLGGYFYVKFDDFSERSLPYMISVTLEESLEMSGILIFIFSLLHYLKSYAPKFTLSIE